MKTKVTLRIDADLLREVRVVAAEEGRCVGALLSALLADLVRDRKAFVKARRRARRVPAVDEKPLHWVGSAKRDFLNFPASVKDGMGNVLGIAQFGGSAPTAKPWKGLGP